MKKNAKRWIKERKDISGDNSEKKTKKGQKILSWNKKDKFGTK